MQWNITRMDAYPQYEGHEKVVSTVYWRLLETTEGGQHGQVNGATNVSIDSNNFTPYEELTEAQVVLWVKDAIGPEAIASYEQNVLDQIAVEINPPIITPELPW
jgi:hypothetical protein